MDGRNQVRNKGLHRHDPITAWRMQVVRIDSFSNFLAKAVNTLLHFAPLDYFPLVPTHPPR